MKILIVLGLAAATMLSPVRASAAPAAQACSTAPAADAAGQITASGNGKENTRPFALAGGAYTVRWSAADKATGAGNVIVYLKRADVATGSELLVNTIVGREGSALSGETQVYRTVRGSYYLDVTAPSDWSVSITPQ